VEDDALPCRYLLIVPVVGCLLITAGTVIMGIVRIVTAGAKLVRAGDYSAKAAKIMSLTVIEIIDLFLVATVAYIAAAGLYKLFISKTQIELPTRLKISSLKDLEDKIIERIKVERSVTQPPPHRSRRAVLPHRALRICSLTH
jgi:uncharacterized membrane protein YqhA